MGHHGQIDMKQPHTEIRSSQVAFAASLETALQADGARLSPTASLALQALSALARRLASLVDPASALASAGINASAFFDAIGAKCDEPLLGPLSIPDLLRRLADIGAGRTADADSALASLQARRAGESAS